MTRQLSVIVKTSQTYLEKCPHSIEAATENRDSSNGGDASGKTHAIKGVFEKGLRLADHLQELGSLTEQLQLSKGFSPDSWALGVVAGVLDLRLNETKKRNFSFPAPFLFLLFTMFMSPAVPDSVWSQLHLRADTLNRMLHQKVWNHSWIMHNLVGDAKVWGSGQIFSFQGIVDEKKLKPASIDKLVRYTSVDSLVVSISGLRGEASKLLENMDIALMLVSMFESYYGMLEHPAEVSLDLYRLGSATDAISLTYPKYWSKQLKPYFKPGLHVETNGLASYFSGLLDIEGILKEMKKPQQDLLATPSEFKVGVKGKRPLSARGKAIREALEVWLPTVNRMVTRLEEVETKLRGTP